MAIVRTLSSDDLSMVRGGARRVMASRFYAAVLFILLGCTIAFAKPAGEKTLWKQVQFAIVRFNDEAPQSWNIYHTEKRGVLLVKLWKRYLLLNIKEQEAYEVDPRRADSFYARIRTYWPALEDGRLVPDYCGIRPKLTGPGEAAADFLIDGPGDHRRDAHGQLQHHDRQQFGSADAFRCRHVDGAVNRIIETTSLASLSTPAEMAFAILGDNDRRR